MKGINVVFGFASDRPLLDRRIGAAFSLRSKYGGRRRSSLLGMHEEDLLRSHSVRSNKKGNNRLTFASLRSACPLLDRRIGAAFSLRSKYGGRRRSSLLGMHEI